jgi:hypothetical protein
VSVRFPAHEREMIDGGKRETADSEGWFRFADVEEKELAVGFWSCKSKRGWLLDDERRGKREVLVE